MRKKCDYPYCDEQAMVGYKTCNTHYRIYTLEEELAAETARADKAEEEKLELLEIANNLAADVYSVGCGRDSVDYACCQVCCNEVRGSTNRFDIEHEDDCAVIKLKAIDAAMEK